MKNQVCPIERNSMFSIGRDDKLARRLDPKKLESARLEALTEPKLAHVARRLAKKKKKLPNKRQLLLLPSNRQNKKEKNRAARLRPKKPWASSFGSGVDSLGSLTLEYNDHLFFYWNCKCINTWSKESLLLFIVEIIIYKFHNFLVHFNNYCINMMTFFYDCNCFKLRGKIKWKAEWNNANYGVDYL